jgi:hypothetical protein
MEQTISHIRSTLDQIIRIVIGAELAPALVPARAMANARRRTPLRSEGLRWPC